MSTTIVPTDFTKQVILVTVSSLSLTGSLGIVIAFSLVPKHSFAEQLVLLMSVADTICSIARMFIHVPLLRTTELDKLYCSIGGAFTLYGELSSLLWQLVFSINVYLMVCWRLRAPQARRFLPIYNIVAWGYPLALALYGVLADRMGAGFTNVGCWIAQQDGLAIYGFYYPMAATFIATSVLYFLVLRQVWLIQAAVRRAPVVYEVRLEEGDGAAAGEERESLHVDSIMTDASGASRKVTSVSSNSGHGRAGGHRTALQRSMPHMRRLLPERSPSLLVAIRTSAYMFIFLLCWGPATVLSIYTYVSGNPIPKWGDPIIYPLLPSQGFFNAIVYGANLARHNPTLRRHLSSLCWRLRPVQARTDASEEFSQQSGKQHQHRQPSVCYSLAEQLFMCMCGPCAAAMMPVPSSDAAAAEID